MLTHLSFPTTLSKMVSSSVESRQISYLTRVKKSQEKMPLTSKKLDSDYMRYTPQPELDSPSRKDEDYVPPTTSKVYKPESTLPWQHT